MIIVVVFKKGVVWDAVEIYAGGVEGGREGNLSSLKGHGKSS